MIGSRTIVKYSIYFLIGAAMLIVGGCRFPWSGPSAERYRAPSPKLMKQYRQAVAAYQSEAYGVAAKRFESVQEQAGGSEMARYALYGLACTRLMAANTHRQYHEAIALLDSWAKKAPTDFEKENPMLMVPLVKEKMLFSNIPLTPDGRGDIEASPMVPQWLVINASKEIKRLKVKLENADHSSRMAKDRIRSLEKQMAKLQQKIKALEAIDQKMQEKKSAIPSTEPIAPR